MLPRGLTAAPRRWLGRAVHHAGGAVRADVRDLQSQVDQLTATVAARETRLEASLDALGRVLDPLPARLARCEDLLRIEGFSRFVRHAQLDSAPLVSIILPTYDRPDRLRRAIDSVLAQRYRWWELLVVDDGGQLDSRRIAEETGDTRVKWIRADHGGACAARNVGLTRASGELIAYLDDDNIMDVDWLQAVVWGFEHHPSVDVVYGGIVLDDVLRVHGDSAGALPQAYIHSWNRDALRRGNLADMGAIAHRAGLPEARFDETLRTVGDWDLLLRMTAERDPLVLPAIACYYNSDAPERLSGGPTQAADIAKVMARAAAVAG